MNHKHRTIIDNKMLKYGLYVLEFDEVVENKHRNHPHSINNINDAYDLLFDVMVTMLEKKDYRIPKKLHGAFHIHTYIVDDITDHMNTFGYTLET